MQLNDLMNPPNYLPVFLYKACFLVPESSEILEGWGTAGYFCCIQVLSKAYEGPAEEELKMYFHSVQPQIQGSFPLFLEVQVGLEKQL